MAELIAKNIVVGSIQAELAIRHEAWKERTGRQNSISAQRDTETIFLRSVKKPIPPNTPANDILASELTSQSHKFPHCYRMARRVCILMGGKLGRVMVVRIRPGGRVYRHVNHGDYYASHDRYHLFLNPDASGTLTIGSKNARVCAGDLWSGSLSKTYQLVNNTKEWLVCLTIDLRQEKRKLGATPEQSGQLLSLSPFRFLLSRFGSAAWGRNDSTALGKPLDSEANDAILDDDRDSLPDLSHMLRAMYRKGAKQVESGAKPILLERNGPVYVALRSKGRMLTNAWSSAENHYTSVNQAINGARGKLNAQQRVQVDAIEVCFGEYTKEIALSDEAAISAAGANKRRGSIGFDVLDVGTEKVLQRVAPTTVIATNRNLEKWLQLLLANNKTKDAMPVSKNMRLRLFRADQYLLPLAANAKAYRLHRGVVRVGLEEVTPDATMRLEKLLGDYLIRSLNADGRMRYLYYPSQGKEPAGRNNMIRQWMASLALTRLGTYRNDSKLHKLAAKNIEFNLKHYYSEEKGLGLINEEDKVKLGAIALAALAIHEHPNNTAWSNHSQALMESVNHLWRRRGAFRTFYKPFYRNDCQNFYPGEALLFWSAKYAADENPEILKRFMRSQKYYRKWHLKNRNPAFIPWHTQAYYRVWEKNGDETIAKWIFEMNDWLVPIQQWSDAPAPEMRGRFYDASRPFGPPHASSTGVYLEGLIDAFALARALQDTQRQDRYRRTIIRGLRSIMQLTFKDDIDMFYVAKRDIVRGGVRTTVYNNVIRVDNVQHNLMAIMKILATFEKSDYTERSS